MQRIFSGIQPTGRLHLGNYCGAIRNWVNLQREAAAAGGGAPRPENVLFCIVDLHAMTNPHAAASLRAGVLDMTASLLACGLQPQNGSCTLFLQSSVREHSELAWLLSCVTPLGWLQRMTQFKDKEAARARAVKVAAREGGGGGEGPPPGAPLGLLSYPVLQAADILLYKATHVPVGEDQVQHLELARGIAAAFHTSFGREGGPVFPAPATLLLPTGARIRSLTDGSKKMSKSDPSDDSRINLTDGADAIARKVRSARTDSTPGFTYDPEGRPDKSNLLVLAACVGGERVEDVAARYTSASSVDFKRELTELLVSTLCPIGDDIHRRLGDPSHLLAVLEEGGDRARGIAAATMAEVREVTGHLALGGRAGR